MYTIKELLAAKDKHNHRDEQRAVYEAVDILAGELFTGIDIVTFLSADRALIEQAITDRFKIKNNPGREERMDKYRKSIKETHPKMNK